MDGGEGGDGGVANGECLVIKREWIFRESDARAGGEGECERERGGAVCRVEFQRHLAAGGAGGGKRNKGEGATQRLLQFQTQIRLGGDRPGMRAFAAADSERQRRIVHAVRNKQRIWQRADIAHRRRFARTRAVQGKPAQVWRLSIRAENP